MKYISLFILALSFSYQSFATEGMWLPLLLEKLNIADMQKNGCKLNASDIYDINNASLKDAVISFGGFCTGEVISNQGLILTNHHCGYRQIQSHSSIEQDYLTNGFWASDKSEELPNEDLTATFIVRIEDVTQEVLQNIDIHMDDEMRKKTINERIKAIKAKAIEGTHYNATIKPFFYGNEYYLFVNETFKDVRLVGTPPDAIGKFGGNTDNWMWPRHTGDFSVFRIYADKNNQPATYSIDNVPYQPKHHFPISLKEKTENDFTMVFGFPGTTKEYLTSHAVRHTYKSANPAKINIRETKMDILSLDMRIKAETRIKYASKYASLSNYYKKWKGENLGLKTYKSIQKKELQEGLFLKQLETNKEWKDKYGNIFTVFDSLYPKYETISLTTDYMREALFGIEVVKFTNQFIHLVKTFEDTSKTLEAKEEARLKFKKSSAKHFKDYNLSTDIKLFEALSEIYIRDVDSTYQTKTLKFIKEKYHTDVYRITDSLFSKTIFTDERNLNTLLSNFNTNAIDSIKNDPIYIFTKEIHDLYYDIVIKKLIKQNTAITVNYKLYVEAIRKMNPNKIYYPDANSTLRISYGKISHYNPKDGIKYDYFSTSEGILQKYDPENKDYHLPQKLINLLEKKDFGQYSDQLGKLRVCFTASNHTTGGNSGSPVIDAEGNLIGINFDRNWEGTMSDIMYDPNKCRNIAVDIRYVLFIIDKYAGAKHLIEEMTLIK